MRKVFIDGKHRRGARATVTNDAVRIVTQAGKKSAPRKVIRKRQTRIDKGAGNLQITIPANSTVSIPMKVPAGKGVAGHLSFVAATGYSGVKKEAWFSWKPAGAALRRQRSSTEGTSSTNLRWTCGPNASTSCRLNPGSLIWVNIQNKNAAKDSVVLLNRYSS